MKSFKIWAALSALSLGGVPVAAHAERPVSDFTSDDTVGWVAMSPSGTHIAAEMDRGGERRIVILPLNRQGDPVVIGKPADADVYSVQWVNDDWLIATVGRTGNYKLHEVYVTRTMAFRADGTEVHMLEPRNGDMADSGGDVIWVARDGTPRILLSYRESIFIDEPGFFPKVAMVDVAANKFSRVTSETEGVWEWFADGQGNVRLGFGSEQGGAKRRLVYREGGSGLFKEVGSASGDDELISPVLFQPDGGALTISNVVGFDALYELDLKTMRRGEKVFGVSGHDISGIRTDPQRQELRGAIWNAQHRQVQWFDPKYREIQALLNATLPGQSPTILSSSLDDTKHVIYAGGNAEVTGYMVFDSAAKKLTMLSRGRNETMWPASRTYRYSARDGLEMDAIVTLPGDREAKNLPVIVMPHGGPRARDYEGWDTWAQFFADRGYAVIQPNFRGSTGYGTAFEKAGLGEWGLKMQDDVDDALAWAAGKGMVDRSRACIVGGSYGGYVAMRAAQRNPELYRCAISFAGVGDLAKMIGHDGESYFGRGLRDYWKGQVSDLAAVSPINNVDGVGIPILLVHGKEDQRVPVDQSRDMAKKLRAAGKNVTYIEQPKNDHHFSRDEDMVEFLQAAESFLDTHNPA